MVIDFNHIKEINKELFDSNLIEILPSDNDGFITFTVNIKKEDLTKKDIDILKSKNLVISDKNNKFKTTKLEIKVDDKRYQKDDWSLTETINFNIVENYIDKDNNQYADNGYLVIPNKNFLDHITNSIYGPHNNYNFTINEAHFKQIVLSEKDNDIKLSNLFSYHLFSDQYIIKTPKDNKQEGWNIGQTKEGNFKPGQKVWAFIIYLRPIKQINDNIKDENLKNRVKKIREEIKKGNYNIDVKLKFASPRVHFDYSTKEARFVAGPKWPKE